MSKKGMKRPNETHTEKRNTVPPVPELQGKAKNSKKAAIPVIEGTKSQAYKVRHEEKPISSAYPAIDNDLARDNLENDIPEADKRDS